MTIRTLDQHIECTEGIGKVTKNERTRPCTPHRETWDSWTMRWSKS
jgi:hypothetical protein